MERIADSSSSHDHHVIWPEANGPSTYDFTSVTPLPHGHIKRFAAVRAAIRYVRPDVVHAHSSFGGVYARLQKLSVPVIYQPHCFKFEDEDSSVLARWAYRLVEKCLLLRTDALVVLSPREDAISRALDSTVARYLVPNVATVPPGTSSEGGGGMSEVVMIGRLSAQKDPAFFLRVARKVRLVRPGTSFTWIGGGSVDDIEKMRSAGVRVTGWLGQQDLVAELARPSAYFHSARYEGFPLSVLDAAASGHPVVVRKIPAFEGTNLLQVDGEDAAVNSILGVLAGGPERYSALAGVRHLNEAMNISRQRSSLAELYGRYSTHETTTEGEVA
jgi:glycosyltransferase involved in cell wall biosynthesis